MGLCVFSLPIFLMTIVRICVLYFIIIIKSDMCASSYHRQIGSMTHLPLFRVKSWKKAMRCMSFYNLTNPAYVASYLWVQYIHHCKKGKPAFVVLRNRKEDFSWAMIMSDTFFFQIKKYPRIDMDPTSRSHLKVSIRGSSVSPIGGAWQHRMLKATSCGRNWRVFDMWDSALPLARGEFFTPCRLNVCVSGAKQASHISGPSSHLTHWGRDKMDAISLTTFSSTFSWMKMFEFRLKFHWSLFLRVQLTISQHWFK